MGLFKRTDFQTEPDWPTTVRSRLSNGRIVAVDSSMWLYRAVPLGPVLDAASPTDGLRTADPLLQAFGELSDLTHVNVSRRAVARRNYRDVHLLLINLPQPYVPHESPLAGRLAEDFAHKNVERRLLLLGVRLIPKTGSDGSFASAVESITDSLIQGGRPGSDYDRDYRAVDAALARCGLRTPSTAEFRLANAWWNNGRYADTPTLVHTGHMHVFDNNVAVRAANQAGAEDCADWPHIPGTKAVSFLSVQDFDLPFVPATSRQAQWVPGLLSNGCVALSIRGKIEPASVTRDELRRNRKRYMDDIAERAENGKMERAEEQEMLADLESVEAGYSGGGAPATLTDASVIACVGGVVEDPDDLSRSVGLVLRSMDNREPAAMSETMLASPTRSNPHLHDLPVTTIAYSGIVSLNQVGDKEGALVGFTERDRQPALLLPSAASRSDSYPLAIVPGSTGSGKSLAGLYLASQFTELGVPVVFVDPKQSISSHDAVVEAFGGQVASLDNLSTADGVFDPLRFSKTPEQGIEMASSLLMQVNPWGSEDRRLNMETPLVHALRVGVSNGAECIGDALRLAQRHGAASDELTKPIFDLADALPMFRACVGMEPGTAPLSVSNTITLIKTGTAHLDLPEAGSPAQSQTQRISLALVRMMVFGAASALADRGTQGGVLMLDEAWVMLAAGRSEIDRLGRLARSWNVMPMLFTQKVTDFLDAGLEGYISRGLILPLGDEDQSRAAFELFGLEPTPERISRNTATATVGGSDGEGGAPNWASMRHLRDPRTKETLRGSIAYYCDLSGRAVPVQVDIPKWFIELASTNPEDIARRKALLAAGQTSGSPSPRTHLSV